MKQAPRSTRTNLAPSSGAPGVLIVVVRGLDPFLRQSRRLVRLEDHRTNASSSGSAKKHGAGKFTRVCVRACVQGMGLEGVREGEGGEGVRGGRGEGGGKG